MPRPKKGSKNGELAIEKWRQTVKLRYGDVSAKMRETGRKGGRMSSGGGFASNPALAKTAGAKGGRLSKRGPSLAKLFKEKDAQIREMYLNPDYSVADISRELGLPYTSLRYWLNKHYEIEKFERQ